MLAMEFMFAILGIVLLVLGWQNWKGDVSSIHFYHRSRISQADVSLYGKWMGAATMLIGADFLITAVLVFFFGDELIWFILPGLAIGITIMIYAQFRFNKGIF